MPWLVKCRDHPVATQRFGEEALRPYLAPLTPSQAKLIAIYVQRARVSDIMPAWPRIVGVGMLDSNFRMPMQLTSLMYAQMKSAQTLARHPDRENFLPADEVGDIASGS